MTDSTKPTPTTLSVVDKLKWLQALAADAALTPLALRLACVLTEYFNSLSGDAWPSIETLASELGASERGIQKAVAVLVARGHLRVTVGGGRKLSNHYRPILKTPNAGSWFRDQNPERQRQKTPNGRSPEPFKEHTERVSNETLSVGVREIDPLGGARLEAAPPELFPSPPINEKEFLEFWRQFPKHTGIDGARRAFAEAVAGGADPKAIIAVAMRFAAERTGQPERFTPSAANWLRDGRWKDPPAQINGADPGRPRRNRKDAMLDNLFAAAEKLRQEGR
jgi:hypothetical protein